MTQLESNKSRIPSDILFAYAVGDLDPGIRLLVGCQASFNPRAAQEIAFNEALGGAFLEHETPQPMSEGALEDVMSRLDQLRADVRPPAQDSSVYREVNLLPEPAKSIALRHADGDGWSFMAPGVKCMDLSGDPELKGTTVDVRLMRLEPGKGAPKHTHGGSELTLVLTGAFRDETGVYGPGDLSVATPKLTHRPIAEPGDVCIALAVTDAPLELTGVMGGVQRLLRRVSLIK